MANPRLLSSIAISLNVARSGARSLRGVSKLVPGVAKLTQEGDIFVHLQTDLGERRYTKLCEDVDLALEEIHYCQEALGNVRITAQDDENDQETVSPAQGEQMRQMKDLINHDYLVLKLRPGDPTAEVVHIKAHKADDGIHIEYIPSSGITNVFHEGVRCLTVDCSKQRIRLEAVVAILKQENPDYSAIFANCWYYAQKTAKRLVKACIETPGISSAEKARLQKEHDTLEPNLIITHFQNAAKSLLLRSAQSNIRAGSGLSVSVAQ